MDPEQISKILKKALSLGKKELPKGHVADYIPELAKARPDALGICVVGPDGIAYKAGDTNIPFSIQSISKVFSLCMALELHGVEKVFSRVGMEPSGEAFNSIVELDLQSGKPYNPFINSGAITIESMILDYRSFDDMLAFTRALCLDEDITLNRQVFNSEMATCDRNRAIAYLLKSKNVITTNVDSSIELYTRMCAMNVTAESLANFGLVLALGGIDPRNGKRLLKASTVQTVKTIMLTCGMYDGSGQFAVEVGIPTKSGVGGGLLSVADKRMGIGVFGPALDEKGNCVGGKVMLKYLADKMELHLFQ